MSKYWPGSRYSAVSVVLCIINVNLFWGCTWSIRFSSQSHNNQRDLIHWKLAQCLLPIVSTTALLSFPRHSRPICFLGHLQKINLGILMYAFWILFFPQHSWIASTSIQTPVLRKVKADVTVVSTILWIQFWPQDIQMLLVRDHLL